MLSEVGMLPVFLMGLKLKILGIIIKIFYREIKILKDSVVKLAYSLTNKKFTNLILINYSPELEELLYWYQQLIAESLGKKEKVFYL